MCANTMNVFHLVSVNWKCEKEMYFSFVRSEYHFLIRSIQSA